MQQNNCSIEHEAREFGIVKIVPPKGWAPRKELYAAGGKAVTTKFETKLQNVHRLQVRVVCAAAGRSHLHSPMGRHRHGWRGDGGVVAGGATLST